MRRNEVVNQLNDAVYTSCNICADNGAPKSPTWSISASRIVQDRQHQVIYYRNAVVRVLGIPIFYAPVFWHPDPTAPRRSGFLTPKFELSNRRGFSYQQPYLVTLGASTDLIISPQLNTKVNPMLNLRYTERFYSGEIDLRGGYTYEYNFNNHVKFGDDTSRSWFLGRGLFDVTPDKNWVWGFGIERVTDPTLFERYNITQVYQDRGPFPADTDRLITQLYTVKANDTSYLSAGRARFREPARLQRRCRHRAGHLRVLPRLPHRRAPAGGALRSAPADPRRPASDHRQRGGAQPQRQPGDLGL